MSILDWFKRKQVDVEPVVQSMDCQCKHDWEVVEIGSHSRSYTRNVTGQWCRNNRDHSQFFYMSVPIEMSCRKVCLICGECVDTIAEAEAEILAREKNTRDREELAKKMWEDCKGVAHD